MFLLTLSFISYFKCSSYLWSWSLSYHQCMVTAYRGFKRWWRCKVYSRVHFYLERLSIHGLYHLSTHLSSWHSFLQHPSTGNILWIVLPLILLASKSLKCGVPSSLLHFRNAITPDCSSNDNLDDDYYGYGSYDYSCGYGSFGSKPWDIYCTYEHSIKLSISLNVSFSALFILDIEILLWLVNMMVRM